jgi:hypothetical protein
VIPNQAPAADSLRAVLDSVFSQPEYRWVGIPHPLAFLRRWWQLLQDWLAAARERHPDLFSAFFWILIAILAAILVHGIWVMAQTLRAANAPATSGDAAPAEIRGASWYRREALRLARLNRYPEAMQADFLGLVLELDHRRLLRFHPSKTPGEYITEAQLAQPSRDAFRALVRTLYGYAFAREPCGPEEFAAWRTRSAGEQYAAAH